MAATALSASAAAAPVLSVLLPLVGLIVLLGVVFACVHHADVIAHRTGEPYGTLVLTIAVTVIEVALILSIMLAGDGQPTLARETVFSVIMIVCNGVVGLCIILGGLRYGEQGFQVPGINAYLVVLIPLATLVLILPTYTTSVPGGYYTPSQLAFVALATLLLYGVFLYVQTVRHRNYFLSDLVSGRDDDTAPASRQLWESVVMLLVGLIAVVLLAKSVAGSIETVVSAIGAPTEAVGLLVASLVLLPETVAALGAQRAAEEPQPRPRLLARHHRPHHSGGQHPRPDPEGPAGARRRHARYRPSGPDLRGQHRHVRRRADQHPAGVRASRPVRDLCLPRLRSVNRFACLPAVANRARTKH
jgi:Ca2+:H+ antiporter